MVNKDMNGFPVKKCSAFQFFKKRVRRWIKSPMVSVEKHPHASLKYPASTVMHLPPGDSELEPPLCQTCLSDHPFQRGITPQEAESCSWESQRSIFEQISSNTKEYFPVLQKLWCREVMLSFQDNEKDQDLLIFSLLSHNYKTTLLPPSNHI
uniref:Uncharacterized protein n=1 Tax=Buteo japonicus TaxID=224669 RepID=A0A8C0HS19_9AVES